MLKIAGLNLKLGEFSLKEINLELKAGEFFVLLGPNGAGKTLLLESIAGHIPLKSGRIFLSGEEITRLPPKKGKSAWSIRIFPFFPT